MTKIEVGKTYKFSIIRHISGPFLKQKYNNTFILLLYHREHKVTDKYLNQHRRFSYTHNYIIGEVHEITLRSAVRPSPFIEIILKDNEKLEFYE